MPPMCELASFSEGSPQFIKEAMACNKPIVATDVGDISERFGKAPNLRITTFEPENVRNAISDVMNQEFPNSIVWVQELNHRIIAEKIISIYKTIIKKTK